MFKPYIFPIENQITLNPGPYTTINPDWFWMKHSEFIKPLNRKSAREKKYTFQSNLYEKEKEVIQKVKKLEIEEVSITKDEYHQQFSLINKYAWEQSRLMIK
jgi:hypothetical protein